MAQKLLKFLVTVIVIGAIYWILEWTIGATGLGNPFAKIAHIAIVVVAVFALINAILAVFDKAVIDW